MIKIFIVVFSFFLISQSTSANFSPRLDRDWAKDQRILAEIKFYDDKVTIKNIRDITYRSVDYFDVKFYDQTFNLDEIESAWYMVEDIGKFNAAHTLVSFGFKDGSYIAISAEIRREQGESFNALKGMFRQFELVYIIASESDVIKLRTNYRKNLVQLFPLKIKQKNLRLIFVDMLKRAKSLATYPEFYHTITNNCTTNPIYHIRNFSDKNIPRFHLSYVLPQYSDKVFYQAGILDTELSIKEARTYFMITEKAQACGKDDDFSACIRR